MLRGAGPLLSIAVALGGYQDTAPALSTSPAADEPAPGTFYIDLPEGTSRYVALGDSYSAGEGVEPYEPGAGDYPEDDCHRSIAAYPRRLVFDAGVTTEFFACSGARVRHILDEAQTTAAGRATNRYGVQVKPWTLGPDVGLITATIGGNDANFSAVLNACATSADCLDQPYVTDDGAMYGSLREWSTQFLAEYPILIEELASRLRVGAPNARILLIGYPHLFPLLGVLPTDTPTCSIGLGDNPRGYGFDEEEQRGINTLVDALNSATNSAALRSDVEFLAPTDHWIGHVPCADRFPWTNFIDVQAGLPPSLRRSSFHPNFDGHREYARLIGCYFRAYPEPNDPAEIMEGRSLPVGAWLLGVDLPCDSPD